jgi:hypothetical protein
MNFIEVTNPYARQLEAWKNGHGFSDRKALQELSDIWDEFSRIPERAEVIYGSKKTVVPSTDLGCGPCVTGLLQFITNWRRLLENEIPVVEFKGIPQAQVIELKGDNYSDLKMHEVRAIAKRKGIEYSNTTPKDEIVRMLNEKR